MHYVNFIDKLNFFYRKMEVKINKINPDVTIPRKSTNGSAGFDLYNNSETTIIEPNERKFFKTGIKIEIPEKYAGFIFARSGLGCNYGIVPSNCVGVIDSDYRGEIIVCLHNHSNENYEVKHNDKIAQLVIMKVPSITLTLTDDLTSTERDNGGFGSTGQ